MSLLPRFLTKVAEQLTRLDSNGGCSREQTDGRLLQSKIVGVAGRCASSFIRTKKATLKITSQRLRGDSLGGTRKSPDQVLPYGRGGFRRGDRTQCLRTKALKTRKATLNGCQRVRFSGFYVRIKGLEPPRLSASDPKSDVATNYTISAWLCAQRYEIFFESSNGGRFIQSATSLQV